MDYLKAFLGGLVEGLSNALPISGSGHRVLFEKLVGVAIPAVLGPAVVLALLLVFRDRVGLALGGIKESLAQHKKGKFRWHKAKHHQKLLPWALAAAVPYWVAIFCQRQFGFLEGLGSSLILAATMLVINGGILYIGDHSICRQWTAAQMSGGHAIKLGLFQAVSILPGLSQMGLTLCMGRNMGYEKEAALDLSICSGIIALLGGELLTLHCTIPAIGRIDLWAVAFAGAFCAALLGAWLLKKLMEKDKLFYLLIYCVVAAIGAIVLSSI